MKPSTRKAFFLAIGLFFSWLSLYMILSAFYSGLVQVVVSAIEGGTYSSILFQGVFLILWFLMASLSSLFISIALTEEESEEKRETEEEESQEAQG